MGTTQPVRGNHVEALPTKTRRPSPVGMKGGRSTGESIPQESSRRSWHPLCPGARENHCTPVPVFESQAGTTNSIDNKGEALHRARTAGT